MSFTVSSSFQTFRRYTKGWSSRTDNRFFGRSTIRDAGRGSSQRVIKSGGDEGPQTYEDIKAQCLEEGTLWEDPDFPAEDASMYYKDPPSVWPDIEWLRPTVSIYNNEIIF